MKVLVGILYSGEPQFAKCIDSVKAQEEVEFDYFIIENLPKNEAHDKLYNTFMSKAVEFDIFVKLDADMIIQAKDFFKFIIGIYLNNQFLDWLHIYIYDYITDKLISGLNVYSSNVKWNMNKDNIFTDRGHVVGSIRNKKILKNPAQQWVIHCPDASKEQAFNFGLHRAVKAYQFDNNTEIKRNTDHGVVLSKLYYNYLRKRNKIRLYAIYGYLMVLDYKLDANTINRNSSYRVGLIKKLENMSSSELNKYIYTSWKFYVLVFGYKLGYVAILNYLKR